MKLERYEIGATRHVNYAIMDSVAEMFEFGKTNTGIYRIDNKNKKVLAFMSSYEAQMYTERVEKVSLSLAVLNDTARHGEVARENRYYKGYLWVYIQGFNEDELKNAMKSAPKRFKNSKGVEFEDLAEAVKWVKDKKISAASDKIIGNSITKNLNRLSQKSYYMTWDYV
jgi:hypothetical protein